MEKTTDSNLQQMRVALQREFIERSRRNPAYSLRAYAKFLEIDQSFLSKILKGDRRITKDFGEVIAVKLGIKNQPVKKRHTQELSKPPGFLPLSDDEFEFISEWHHFAILEFLKTESRELNSSKISQRLGLHVEQVRDAIERLERLGFLKRTDGRLTLLAPKNTWTNSRKTTVARKKLQRTWIEKSLDAIDHIPFELRDNGSVTVAINKKRLPEFKEKLESIRNDLANYFQSHGEKNLDEVYQLTVSFFPLTQIKE